MKLKLHYWSHVASFFSEWEMFQTTIMEKIKTNKFYVLLTVHRSVFIPVFNQLYAQNLFHNKFYFTPLHVSSTCAHHQEVKIALRSLWYHHTYRWPSRAQVERGLPWNKFCSSSWLNTEINKFGSITFFFLKLCQLWKMCNNIVQPDRPQMWHSRTGHRCGTAG
jgi:hypothetical protein